jgi:hypothetical protein
MDLDKLSIAELKVIGFDMTQALNNLQRNLSAVINQIAKREEMAKADHPPKEE